MTKIENIVLHCSDSAWGCVREIRNWHLQRGWKEIGYHFVILNGWVLPKLSLPSLDGSIECGRYLNEDSFITDNEVGAHALGYNEKSVGICLIGKKTFTANQLSSLLRLVRELIVAFELRPEDIIGHCETEEGRKQGKTCPNFDVSKIRQSLEALDLSGVL